MPGWRRCPRRSPAGLDRCESVPRFTFWYVSTRCRRVGAVGSTSARRAYQCWCDGGKTTGFRVARLMRALIETEWRVIIPHQGHVGEDAVEPAVDANQQVE